MTLARTLLIILVGAFVGLPLAADNGQGPGGDGGVVILPGSTIIKSGPNIIGEGDEIFRVVISGSGPVFLQLPAGMVDAYAVMLVEGIDVPLRVIAGQVEIDADTIESMIDTGVERAQVLVVAGNTDAILIAIEFK